MTMITYNNNVPFGPDNPSADQPKMLTNTQHIADYVAVDHVPFNVNGSGWHNKSTYVNQSSVPTTAAGQVALFSAAGISGSELHMTRDATSGVNVIMTTSAFGVPVAANNGYTFLPGPSGGARVGAIILQWGIIPVGPSGDTVTTVLFATVNQNFKNACYNVQLTVIAQNTDEDPSANNVFIVPGSVNATGFQISNSSSSSEQQVYWLAIGN